MQLRGKSPYNLLRIERTNTSKNLSWQVEDLRKIKLSTLFARLGSLGVFLNQKSFIELAQSFDNPEELTTYVCRTKQRNQTKCYLLLFELWRRLLPENPPLSLFCDRLDYLIEAYDAGTLEEVDLLQEALESLEDILDNAVDKKGIPEEVFLYVCSYSAHDLEGFLLDYIADQMIEGNYISASELLDAFSSYVIYKKRFESLRICLFLLTDAPSASLMLERFLEHLLEEPDFEALLILMDYLMYRGNQKLFFRIVKQVLFSLETQQQFQDVLEMIAEHYHYMGQKEEEKRISAIAFSQKENAEELLDRKDPIYLQVVKEVLENT